MKGLRISNLNVEDLCRQISLISPKMNERPRLLFEKGDVQFLTSVTGKINKFMFDHKQMEKIILLQSVIRFWNVKKRFRTMKKVDMDNLRKKNAVFLDLLKTEANYLQSIDSLIKNFVIPIRHSEFVAPNECAFLFSNIESIAEEHHKLYNRLDQLRSNWPFIGIYFPPPSSFLLLLSLFTLFPPPLLLPLYSSFLFPPSLFPLLPLHIFLPFSFSFFLLPLSSFSIPPSPSIFPPSFSLSSLFHLSSLLPIVFLSSIHWQLLQRERGRRRGRKRH